MIKLKVILLTAVTMLAFATNSILCRFALRGEHIDAASFTLIRLASGAVMLWLITGVSSDFVRKNGSWLSAFALFAYAGGFSFAYLTLPAGAGALLLFGAVQVAMAGYGIWQGERLSVLQSIGLGIACVGFIGLLLPGLSAPPLGGAMLMVFAGMAWSVYSLRGREGIGKAAAITAGNFIRAVPFAAGLILITLPDVKADASGVGFAIASGALASGLGYVVWYKTLPQLSATNAATVQLSVPAIAAFAGTAFLDESITLRLVLASGAVLGGIALVILSRSIRK